MHIPESSSDSSDMDDSYGEESNDDNCIDEDGNEPDAFNLMTFGNS